MSRRVIADDGLDIVEALGPDLTSAEYDEIATLITAFNRLLEVWQANWEAVTKAPTFSLKRARRDPLSLDAYARRQLSRIRRLQKTFATPKYRGVIYDAIRLGYHQADAHWRFNRGEHTRHGIKQRQGSRQGGRTSAQGRREDQRDTRRLVRDEARRIRRQHPYNRTTYSTRRLSTTIGETLQCPASTVRDHLRALNRR